MAKTKVLICVKTYPTLSEKYDELVCTAGVREDGSWIRIYPVPFRKLDYGNRYSKWQWIELDLIRNSKDLRQESFRPNLDSPIKLLSKVGTDKSWRERKNLVLGNVKTNMTELIAEAKDPQKRTSLAVLKPSKVIDFIWEPCEREWDKSKLEAVKARQAQLDLFEQEEAATIFEVVKKIPYKFSYIFETEDGKEISNKKYLYNEKYKTFEDIYFVFNDGYYHNDTSDVFELSSVGLMLNQDGFYKEIAKSLEMSSDDVYIFHYVEGYVILKNYVPNMHKTICVYHQQGGLYYESLAMGNPEDKEVEQFFNDLMALTFNEVSILAFPSKGAIEACKATTPGIEAIMDKKDIRVLYNGCSVNVNDASKDQYINDLVTILDGYKGYKFITTATLNEAKGVERLPAFFTQLRDKNINFLWVLIGNGVKGEEIARLIGDLQGYVIWIPDHIDNADVMRLNRVCDFYILAHRFSIFDFATVEAMHLETIPILTDVGGNKEMIVDNNVSKENVTRYATHQGYKVEVTEKDNEFYLNIKK